MLADVTIIMSWGAVAVLVTLVLAYLGTVGALFWKIYDHATNNDRHLPAHVTPVSTTTCKDITESLQKYIADAEKRQIAALQEVKDTIKELRESFLSTIRKE